jgi:hypothetical protein
MSPPVPLYQAIHQQIKTVTAPQRWRASAVTRLAVLVTGILAAESCVLSQMASALWALDVTRASQATSIGRRLRRILNDERLSAAQWYTPLVAQAIDWAAVLRGSRRVVLAIDESTQGAHLHLLRASVTYWGGAVTLAWRVWPQQAPLGAGAYWAAVDALLADVAQVLPTGLTVIVLADRAYDIAPFVDRIAAHGWHWIVRAKANSALRFRDARGHEHELRLLLRQHLPAAGRRWLARGQVFKDAGWRTASVVALWEAGYAEPLVVLSDLPAGWRLALLDRRRYWIEPGFRQDKGKGWQWEHRQVRDQAHQERLLVGMAWASLLVLCLGVAEAQARLRTARERLDRPRHARRPEHARASQFTLGLQCLRRWLYQPTRGTLTWHLPDVNAASWTRQWEHVQLRHAHHETVRP